MFVYQRVYPQMVLLQRTTSPAGPAPRHPPVAPTCQAIQGIDAEGTFDEIGPAVADSLKAISKDMTNIWVNNHIYIYVYIYIYIYINIYIYT